MALNDLRNRKKKKVGSNWVGENTTWVGRNDNVIASKAGRQKKTSSGKKVTGGQGGRKTRYSSGVKSRTDLLAGAKKLAKHVGDGLSMAKGPTNRKPKVNKPKKKKRTYFADTSQWD